MIAQVCKALKAMKAPKNRENGPPGQVQDTPNDELSFESEEFKSNKEEEKIISTDGMP